MTQPAAAQHFADPAAASAYAAYRQAQIEEFGTYEATEVITVGGVPAWLPGHPVPKSTVEAHPWLAEKVRRVAPAPEPGVDRGEQLRARAEQLRAEQAAIEAELAEQETAAEPDGPNGPKPRRSPARPKSEE